MFNNLKLIPPPFYKCPGYDTKLSYGEAGALGNMEYSFIAITL